MLRRPPFLDTKLGLTTSNCVASSTFEFLVRRSLRIECSGGNPGERLFVERFHTLYKVRAWCTKDDEAVVIVLSVGGEFRINNDLVVKFWLLFINGCGGVPPLNPLASDVGADELRTLPPIVTRIMLSLPAPVAVLERKRLLAIPGLSVIRATGGIFPLPLVSIPVQGVPTRPFGTGTTVDQRTDILRVIVVGICAWVCHDKLGIQRLPGLVNYVSALLGSADRSVRCVLSEEEEHFLCLHGIAVDRSWHDGVADNHRIATEVVRALSNFAHAMDRAEQRMSYARTDYDLVTWDLATVARAVASHKLVDTSVGHGAGGMSVRYSTISEVLYALRFNSIDTVAFREVIAIVRDNPSICVLRVTGDSVSAAFARSVDEPQFVYRVWTICPETKTNVVFGLCSPHVLDAVAFRVSGANAKFDQAVCVLNTNNVAVPQCVAMTVLTQSVLRPGTPPDLTYISHVFYALVQFCSALPHANFESERAYRACVRSVRYLWSVMVNGDQIVLADQDIRKVVAELVPGVDLDPSTGVYGGFASLVRVATFIVGLVDALKDSPALLGVVVTKINPELEEYGPCASDVPTSISTCIDMFGLVTRWAGDDFVEGKHPWNGVTRKSFSIGLTLMVGCLYPPEKTEPTGTDAYVAPIKQDFFADLVDCVDVNAMRHFRSSR